MIHDPQSALVRGRECIRIEMEALQATAEGLDASFVAVVEAVEAAAAAGRKLIFSGVGKSAHIAQKLAGTFNSTGVTSCFLDATQALHGDLGLCARGDLAVLLSNSGQSVEMLRLLAMLKRFELTIVALTSNPDSEIARKADLRLLYRVPREACPLRLAPTASTTAALATGDALAMVLLERRGFTRDDFARLHPSGSLGTALLLKVTEIMRTGDRLPVMPDKRTVQDAILGMTKAKAGCIALVDETTGQLTGILTDGDFRRHVLSSRDVLSQPVAQFMTRAPKTVPVDALAMDALRVFDHYKIDDLIVVDGADRPVGLIDVQDLPKMKLL